MSSDNETSSNATPKDVKEILKIKLSDPKEPLYIYNGWCKTCGICIAFCPHKALEWGKSGYPSVINDKCKKCSMCEYRCPEFAITILQERR